MDKKDEKIIRDIVKAELKKELKDNEKKMKDMFMQLIQKEIDKAEKKSLNKQDVKDIIIKAFIQQNKFMWEKSSVVTQYMNKV